MNIVPSRPAVAQHLRDLARLRHDGYLMTHRIERAMALLSWRLSVTTAS